MVEEGLHPEVVVHSQGLEFLGKGKVCEDHIMDLNRGKSGFNQLRPDLCQGYSLRLTGTRGLEAKGGVEGVVDAFQS